MANKPNMVIDLNVESCNSSSAHYDRPDHSILSDIDPDFNYLNSIKESINSNYYNETTFKNRYKSNSNFSLLHLNIRSVVSHFTEFLCYLDTLNFVFKVIALSETAINATSINYNIPNYSCEMNIRENRKGGGVSLYVHNTFQYKVRNDLQLGGVVNSVFVELLKTTTNGKHNIICGCIYRPPSMSLSVFNELLSDMFGKILSENKYVYIFGDFNVNTMSSVIGNANTQEFKDIFSSNYCLPLITKPTRVTNSCSSLIDNIYSNVPINPGKCNSGILEVSISDHYAIFAIDNSTHTKANASNVTKRSFCNKNIENFKRCLTNQSWDFVYESEDLQAAFSRFQGVIDVHFNTNFKLHTFTRTYINRHPWMTEALRTQIRLKNSKYKEYVKSNNVDIVESYKDSKRILHSSLRNAEIQYYSEQYELNSGDMFKSWKVLKTILALNSNSEKRQLCLTINNVAVTNSIDIANGFNDFFVSIGPELAKDIHSDINPLTYVNNVNNSIVIFDVSCDEVKNIIRSLKNSSAGHDEFPTFVGKLCVDSYIEPLTFLINYSLKTGVFPSELKLARMVPIFKAGDSSALTNYRPISVLTFFAKVFEKIVYNKLLNFISDNNILYDHQYGFRKGRSTQQAIITLVDKITKSQDIGDIVITLLIDLKKAFDTIHHRILLRKLYSYGIRGSMLKWMESYLTDRSQYVVIDGKVSQTRGIKCGVPQGSILGPLLFIISVNDICNVSPMLFKILYADDTCVLISGNHLNNLIDRLNTELISLNNWFKANKLSLNTKKSFFMIFHRSRIKPNVINKVVIDNHELTQVNSAKYLGVIIDHKLNWIEHISYVKSKMSKGIGIMYKARQFLTKKALLMLYHAYIFPYMTYCIEVWGCASQTQLNCLFLLQKKIIRIMNFSHYLAHTNPLFLTMKVLPLRKIFFYKVGLIMYKYSLNLLPECIAHLYLRNDSIHEHNTRGCHELRVLPGAKTFSNISARIWNVLSNKINCDVSMSIFKCNLKLFLLNNELVLNYPK